MAAHVNAGEVCWCLKSESKQCRVMENLVQSFCLKYIK